MFVDGNFTLQHKSNRKKTVIHRHLSSFQQISANHSAQSIHKIKRKTHAGLLSSKTILPVSNSAKQIN